MWVRPRRWDCVGCVPLPHHQSHQEPGGASTAPYVAPSAARPHNQATAETVQMKRGSGQELQRRYWEWGQVLNRGSVQIQTGVWAQKSPVNKGKNVETVQEYGEIFLKN